MGAVISAEMLAEFAVVAALDELTQSIRARYDGLLNRVGYYLAFEPGDAAQQPIWRNAAGAFAAS